jgi:hypothetical protein
MILSAGCLYLEIVALGNRCVLLSVQRRSVQDKLKMPLVVKMPWLRRQLRHLAYLLRFEPGVLTLICHWLLLVCSERNHWGLQSWNLHLLLRADLCWRDGER